MRFVTIREIIVNRKVSNIKSLSVIEQKPFAENKAL